MNRFRYQSGALFSYCSTILNVMIGIFFTPFLVSRLGQSEYGLYQLIGSLVGYMAVFDCGLGTTITRYVAKYRVEHDRKGMRNFLAICLRIYLLIGVFVLAVCTVLYFNIGRIFTSLSPDQLESARSMFILLAVNISASLIFQSFTAVMNGYEKFSADRLMVIVRSVLRCGLITAFLLMGYRAVSIVVVDTALNVLFCIIRFFYCKLALKVSFRFEFFDRKLIREVFGYSGMIFATYIIGMVSDHTDRVILGITCGTAQVSVCAVGMTLFNLFAQFGQSILNMVLPKATEIHIAGSGQTESYQRIFTKSGRAQALILTAIVAGFTIFGRQFVVLWIGSEYQMSYWVALVLMWAYYIPYTGGAFGQVLTAQSRLKGLIIIYAVSAAINVLISIPLSYRLGAVGAALGTAVMSVLGNIIAAYIYYAKALNVNIRSYFKSVFSGFWITLLLSLCIGALINLLGGDGWGALVGKVTLFLLGYAASTWFISLNRNEKQYVSALIRLLYAGKRRDVKVGE